MELDLQYSEQGTGPALLILHGLYGSGANWGRHAQWLAERHRVLLPDLRNHGRSPHAADMSYPALAGDVRRLLDQADIERAVVLGHSMGGKAAMMLALQNPERVERLIVADIAPVGYTAHGHRQLIAALRALPLAQVKSRADADRQLAEAIPNAMVRQFLLTNLQRRGEGYEWRLPLDILADQLPLIEGFPEVDGAYSGPTLFLHGADSDYVRPEHHSRIGELFPGARIDAVTGAGHWLHVEQAERFADKLRDFLG